MSGVSALYSFGFAEALQELSPPAESSTDKTVDSSVILVKFAYGGDTKLDGKLNIDDHVQIDQGTVSGPIDWIHGDLNLDGQINIDDLLGALAFIAIQGSPL